MQRRRATLLAFATVLASASRATAAPPRLAVLPLSPSGVAASTARMLDEVLVHTLDRLGLHEVMTKSDMNAIIGAQRMNDVLGCDDVACFAEVGGALGVAQVITGTVGQLGDELLISLTLVDVANTRVIARRETRVRAEENLYRRAVERSACDLVGQELDDAEWAAFVAYGDAARRAGEDERDVATWRRHTAAENAAYLAYFDYRSRERVAGRMALDFRTYSERRARADERRGKLAWAVGTVGGGILLLAAGAASLALAPSRADIQNGSYSDYLAASDGAVTQSTYAQVRADVHRHNLMIGVGSALLGVGAVVGTLGVVQLWRLPPSTTFDVEVGAGARSASVMVGWRL